MAHTTPRAAWGVDGCKAGWFYFKLLGSADPEYDRVDTLAEVVDLANARDLILVDIPIGLPKEGTRESAFRKCDDEARTALDKRKSSVFPVPRREVVDSLLGTLKIGETDDALGSRAWKWTNVRPVLRKSGLSVEKGEGRITAQSFAILPKIVEADELFRLPGGAEKMVRETHPEVCFWALNGKKSMKFAKKHGVGFLDRVCLLEKCHEGAKNAIFEACRDPRNGGVGSDDIVDAMACAVTAFLALGNPQTFPTASSAPIESPFDPLNSEPMIVYADPPSGPPRTGTRIVFPCFE